MFFLKTPAKRLHPRLGLASPKPTAERGPGIDFFLREILPYTLGILKSLAKMPAGIPPWDIVFLPGLGGILNLQIFSQRHLRRSGHGSKSDERAKEQLQ